MADALARCSASIVDRWFGPVHVRPVIAGSSEVVAANGVSLRGTNLRHGLWLGFTRGETVTPRFDQRAQDRQRQAFVAGFGHVVELGRKPELLRNGAMPLVILTDEAAKPPLRQFQLEQRKCRVGARAGFNQTNESRLRGPMLRLQAWTRSRDDVGH